MYLFIFIIILFIFFIVNRRNENFLGFYDSLNKALQPNKKMVSVREEPKKFHDIFLRSNYESYLKIQVKSIDKIMIHDNRQQVGFLKTQKHNRFTFNFNILYGHNVEFIIKNNYQIIQIKIESNVFYLNQNDFFYFEKKIGYMTTVGSNTKCFIHQEYIDYINLFGIAFIVKNLYL
jgi:hypothetical protein